MKVWKSTDYYNFREEFNRIEGFNSDIDSWLDNYFGINTWISHKTNWSYLDFVDVNDYNRVKNNINKIANVFGFETTLKSSYNINQTFNYQDANELEKYLEKNIEGIGNEQFRSPITGLTCCGLELNIMEEY